MHRSILFLKARIPGGAASDLFYSPVHVAGHMRGSTYVQPYASTRRKAPERAATVADSRYLAERKATDPRRELPPGLDNTVRALDAQSRDFPWTREEVRDAYGRATEDERAQMAAHGDAADRARSAGNKGTVTRHAKALHALVAAISQREGTGTAADDERRRRDTIAAQTPKAAPAKDWRDEDNWHARTQARMKTLSDDELRYVAKDAAEAAAAGDTMGSRGAGQHRDEAHYAAMELRARQAKAKPAADERWNQLADKAKGWKDPEHGRGIEPKPLHPPIRVTPR